MFCLLLYRTADALCGVAHAGRAKPFSSCTTEDSLQARARFGTGCLSYSKVAMPGLPVSTDPIMGVYTV